MTEGRVQVNGQVVTEPGAKANPLTDIIEVDGARITGAIRGPRVYVLLNKPKGYISAVSDPLHRPVVTDLVKVGKARVYPVGRLDYDAEGVLLLTNDGELSNLLIHPNFHVAKKYLVKVKDVPSQADLERLENGVHLEDGKTFPAKARMIKQTTENCWIELTVTEGRNRLVKRMCMAIGHPVAKLKRVEFAGIKLGTLESGAYRMLTDEEVKALKGLSALKTAAALTKPTIAAKTLRPKRPVAPRKLVRQRNTNGSEEAAARKRVIVLDRPIGLQRTFNRKAADSDRPAAPRRTYDRKTGVGAEKPTGQRRTYDRKAGVGADKPANNKRTFVPSETTGADKPSGTRRTYDRKAGVGADRPASSRRTYDRKTG
ncbi:MAG: hypothetical protein A3J24_07065, partial [Deltaproteobacteria bacterium RIFCSPLOWO2_02_FULL_53_8]